MKKRIVIGLLSIVTLAGSLSAQAATTLDRVVAVVNDSVITRSELNHQMNMVRQQLTQTKTPTPASDVLRKQVLQHLIDVDLQLQTAKQHGIDIDNKKVNDAIRTIAKKNGFSLREMRNKIEQQGLSYSDYRTNIRKEITMAELQKQAVGAGIKIGAAQVSEFLKKAQRQNKAQQQYHVRNILIPLPDAPSAQVISEAKQTASDLLKEIRQGKNFSQAAVAHSAGHLALQGGDLGWRRLAALPEVFAKHVTGMKSHDVAGPIRTANGFHLLKLVAIRQDSQGKLTQQQAEQMLYARQFQQAVQNWLQGLRSKAFIKIVKS